MSKSGLLILAGIAALTAGIGPAQGADAKLFPDETEIVITVHLKQIAAAELVAREKGALDESRAVLDRMAGDQPCLSCLRGLGVDAFRDLRRVRVAGQRGKEFKPAFLVVEGDFAALKLEAKLAAATDSGGVKVTRSGGNTVYEIGVAGAKRQYAALINGTTMVAAESPAALSDALARAAGSKKSGLPKGFCALVEAARDTESVGVVATGHAVSLLMENLTVPNAATAVAAVKTLDAVSAAVTVGKDVQLQVGVFARDDETARLLADAAVNAIATVRHLADQKTGEDKKMAPVADVVKSLVMDNRGAAIFLCGTATLDQVEALMRIPTSRRPEGDPPRRKAG